MKQSTYEADPRVPAVKIVSMRAQRRQVKRGLTKDVEESTWFDFFELTTRR